MKRKWYERILYSSISLLLLLVCATGIWVYLLLHEVTLNPLPLQDNNDKRVILKELNNNLLKSENLTFSFIYQGNQAAILDFDILKSQTLRRVERLSFQRDTNKRFIEQTIVLKNLILKHFNNLDSLMKFQNENRVNETMQKLDSEVQKASEMTRLKMEIRDAANLVETNNITSSEKSSKRDARKAKKEAKNTKNELINTSDSKPTISASDIAKQSTRAITQKINQVKTNAVSKESSFNALKLRLEQANNQVNNEISEIFQSIEEFERKALIQETKDAKQIAAKTNRIISIFSLVSFVLICLIILLIVSLFRKNKLTNLKLRAAKEKSDLLTEAKSRFLATMSHEIRTPLNAISGFTKQLSHENLPEKSAEKIDIIQRSVTHLEQITNDILDLSKLEKESIQLESAPFYPITELKNIQKQFEFLIQSKNNQLEIQSTIDESLQVLGDALRFRQIFFNLIGNATKFSENSTIIVSISMEKKNDETCELTIQVQDKGIGMTEIELERIFDPFEQADSSTTRKYGGTGLGLSITKRIVDLFEGSITIQSKPQKGTTVTVTLPFSQTKFHVEQTKQKMKTEFSFLKDQRILIVDDEPFNRLLLQSIFDHTIPYLIDVESAKEALNYMEKNTFDIMLLDIRMPEMDGFELFDIIKSNPQNADMKIIGLTATLDEKQKNEMLQAGWDDVLAKPINPDDLKSCLEKIIATKSNHNILNFEELYQLTNQNKPVFNDLLQTFLRTTSESVSQLQLVTQQPDFDKIVVADIAHRMAAPFKHLNALNCYQLLKELEKGGRENADHSLLKTIVERVIQLTQNIIEQVKAKLAE